VTKEDEDNLFKALRNPTARDNRALAVFFGIALLCAAYFASGILVSYVSTPIDFVEMATDGKGVLIEVTGLPSYDSALQISQALEPRQIRTSIDYSPTSNGYIIRIGPVSRRSMAERLSDELRQSGHNQITLREGCPEGKDCDPVASVGSGNSPSSAVSEVPIEPGGLTGPIGRTDEVRKRRP